MSTAQALPLKSRPLAGARVGIPPRQVEFPFRAESPRYFYDDNALATAFFAVLSGIFPAGEMYFVESVRHYRDRITDDILKAQVSGFIGQEAIHSREHERLNAFLSERGFDMRVPDRAIRFGLWLLEQVSPSQKLACTTLMEHFTALLAEQLLTDENFRAKADPELLGLWQWHALEELEHKAVAYDVYELVGNSVEERRKTLPLVAAALLPMILGSWAILVARDPRALHFREHAHGLKLLLGKGGFVTRILPKMGVFFGRNFHPAKHDTRALEREWKEKLFGASGSLTGIVRNRAALAA